MNKEQNKNMIIYSLAVMASKTDELMAMINDERNVENEDKT